MTSTKTALILVLVVGLPLQSFQQETPVTSDTILYNIYPEVNETRPDLPSPLLTSENQEYVTAGTQENMYAVIPVTLSNERDICQQLMVDTSDFPVLAKTGLHSEKGLNRVKTITGRTVQEITELGRPNGLSQDGFMAQDENIMSVIKADNRIVGKLGLTHPQLAKPLFHVLNMMDMDLSLDRWNMARHRWDNIQYFFYNHQKVYVEARDTKGGQKSIFNDGIEGGFHIKLWRELSEKELQFLSKHYQHLTPAEFARLKAHLSAINTGEMEPQYIMRYGFYEGHTFWRTDPIAISFIFGLKSLEELNEIFKGNLYEILTDHFIE